MARMNNGGFLSLLVLLVISALLWSGTLAFIKISSLERIIAYEGQKQRARFLADSGLEWARDNLKGNPSWVGGERSLPTGKIRVEVVLLPDGYRLTSRGESGRARHYVYGELETDEEGNFIIMKYGEMYQ